MIRWLSTLTLCLLGWLPTPSVNASETWTIASLEWPPYASATLADQGSAVKRLRRLLAAQNIDLSVAFFPWKRAQELAKSQDYVGYFPAWPEEVTSGFTASDAVAWSHVGIMKLPHAHVPFNSIDELFKHHRVGVVSTYRYPQVVAAAMRKYPENVEGAMSELLLVRKLSGGRHAVAITDPSVMRFFAVGEGISNIETLRIITRSELVLAFRQGEGTQARLRLLNHLLNRDTQRHEAELTAL